MFQLLFPRDIQQGESVTIESVQMTIALTVQEKVARCRADFRMGAAIVINDGADRWLAASSEALTPTRFDAMQKMGNIEITITDRRAITLSTWASEGDIARIALPLGADLNWVRAMADPSDDLKSPMKGPFDPIFGGNPDVHRAALAICKRGFLLPSALLLQVGDVDTGGLFAIELSELAQGLFPSTGGLEPVSKARVPLSVEENSKVHVFRPADGGEEHYAIEIGDPPRDKPVLSRLHSACFTGDLIGSLKCDCGAQLQGAMRAISQEGAGVLLYMNQEGRGIGLANKMRAYALQDEGFDTVESNHRLGFEDDERNFRLGAEILRNMGFSSVRLMTNNPAKVESMEIAGIGVSERVPLKVGENPLNAEYLKTKAAKSGHIL